MNTRRHHLAIGIFMYLYASAVPIASHSQELKQLSPELHKENAESVPEQYAAPAHVLLSEKIKEAQQGAAREITIFYQTVSELEKATAELKRLKRIPKKKKTSAEKTSEQTLAGKIIPSLESLTHLLAEKTLLFVLNKTSGEIHMLRIQEPADEKNSMRYRRKKNIPEKTMRGFPSFTPENNCIVVHEGGNGHNMGLLVICDGRVFPVLALAHFHTKKKRGPDDPVHMYTPYSLQIHDNNLVRGGKVYMRTVIKEAMGKLEEKRVPSKAYPGEFIHWRFSADFLEAILINEHMDHDEFEEANAIIKFEKPEKDHQHPMRLLIEKVFVTIGANREHAYTFSISEKAKACCFAQFIKSTYATMVTEYPEARLEKNFFKGMRDHKNAVQAMILFFDSYLSRFSAKARTLCEQSDNLLQDCLAVAYNSGYGRLNSVIERYGAEWDKPRSTKTLRAGQKIGAQSPKHRRRLPKYILPSQTNIYLEKFRAIRKFEKKAREEDPEDIQISITIIPPRPTIGGFFITPSGGGSSCKRDPQRDGAIPLIAGYPVILRLSDSLYP